MTKSQIRKSITEQRSQISFVELEVLSLKLLEQFKTLDFRNVTTLHIFLPIVEKKEPDTFLFIDWLQATHPEIKIIVPRADFETSLMTHYVYPGRESLIKSLFNILEPSGDELHQGEVDLVLIPMLAFDLKGFRVGYGKGFYDRFLQGITTRKVGICLFPPVDAIEDINEHDVKLDLCLSPHQIYMF